MEKGKPLKFILSAVVVFVILFGMVWVKAYLAGDAQYKAGEAAYGTGDMKNAISDYEAAIHMYTPFAPSVPKSATRLWEIGQGFERSGDYDWALIAFRSLRSSFYAVRSFYTPYPEWITRSEAEITAVLAAKKSAEPAPAPAAPAAEAAKPSK